MKKILIAIPTFENVYTETFKAIYNLESISNYQYDLEFFKGYDCARARNQIVNFAIDNNYEYIFMIDSDVIVPYDALIRLLEIDQDVVFGYYPRKTEPDISEIFKLGERDYLPEHRYTIEFLKTRKKPRLQIKGGGCGCVLIKTTVFNQLSKPYFYYVNYPNGDVLSEDLYFCSQTRDNGIDLYVDTRVKCKHIGKTIV